MPTLRQRRPVKRPTYFVAEDKFKKSWTLVEKKKLLTGLKRYGIRNVETIREKYLPHRTITEINMFLVRMKCREYTQPRIPKVKVPIELWTELAEQLTSGVADYSTTLGNVVQKIENKERHDEKINREDPDWFLIYHYLAMLLSGDELPVLGQIEAGVVLDLLDSLARHLRELDVENQRRLADIKYKLLTTNVESSDKKRVCEIAFNALEQDLLETNGSNVSTAVTNTSSAGDPHEGPSTSNPDPTPSTSADRGQPSGADSEARNGGESSPSSETYVIKPLLAPLYSVNPLCIPVKYLGLRRTTSRP